MSEKSEIEDLESKINLNTETELGQVVKEFTTNNPSSSNLTDDEFRLTWRARSILRRLSPKSVSIIDEFVDGKRSVGGWNTNMKVQAITGVQASRQGIGEKIAGMFQPKQPQ